MEIMDYRKKAYSNILALCSTEDNQDQQDEIALAFPSMSLHDIETLNYIVTTVASDEFSHVGMDEAMRSFFARCLIAHTSGDTDAPSDIYYGAMWESIVSLAHARMKYAVASTPEASRAYLDLTLALFLANNFDAPEDEQLVILIHGRSNKSYQRVRDLNLMLMIDRHPEWCDNVISLVTQHGVRHIAAIEAAITGESERALASGVL